MKNSLPPSLPPSTDSLSKSFDLYGFAFCWSSYSYPYLGFFFAFILLCIRISISNLELSYPRFSFRVYRSVVIFGFWILLSLSRDIRVTLVCVYRLWRYVLEAPTSLGFFAGKWVDPSLRLQCCNLMQLGGVEEMIRVFEVVFVCVVLCSEELMLGIEFRVENVSYWFELEVFELSEYAL